MNIPDVTGFTLGEAKELIENAGMEIISISLTAPPRCRINGVDDACRVVRIRECEEGKIELIVCNPNIS
ncbi:MAG: hypothetical protein ACOX7R_09855 [Acetivibrionales bacterium]|jgi:hypothetical protein